MFRSNFFRRLLLAASLLGNAGIVFAGYYGKAGLRDHGHTGPADGGALSNPSITGGNPTFSTATITRINPGDATEGLYISSNSTVLGQFKYNVAQAGHQFLINGGNLNAPGFSFTGDTNTGVFASAADTVGIVAGGTQSGIFTNSAARFPSGSVTAPGIAFSADTNNGLYYIGVDQWGLTAGGTLIQSQTASGVTFPQNVTFSSSTLVYARKSSTQAITTDADNGLSFSSEIVDRLGEWNGSVFTALRTGYYNVDACIALQGSAAGTLRRFWISGPSTDVRVFHIQVSASNSYTCFSRGYSLTAGDQLQTWFRQDTGGNLDVYGNSTGQETVPSSFIRITREP